MGHIENDIYIFYKNMNIFSYELLSIETISDVLGIDTIYWDDGSAIACKGNKYKIFINQNISVQRQWQDFGHEMSHYCYDEKDSMTLNELYVDYYESKADYFMYHFCVPSFMLQQLKGVTAYDIMDLFNVEFEFALRRIEMYKNNLLKDSGVIYLEKP